MEVIVFIAFLMAMLTIIDGIFTGFAIVGTVTLGCLSIILRGLGVLGALGVIAYILYALISTL